LGVIDHLRNKYPKLKPSDFAKLLGYITDEKHTSINSVISALMSENTANRNYPRKSKEVESLLNSLL
jgi:hypothetical protein